MVGLPVQARVVARVIPAVLAPPQLALEPCIWKLSAAVAVPRAALPLLSAVAVAVAVLTLLVEAQQPTQVLREVARKALQRIRITVVAVVPAAARLRQAPPEQPVTVSMAVAVAVAHRLMV
jgi:hypothetical protein